MAHLIEPLEGELPRRARRRGRHRRLRLRELPVRGVREQRADEEPEATPENRLFQGGPLLALRARRRVLLRLGLRRVRGRIFDRDVVRVRAHRRDLAVRALHGDRQWRQLHGIAARLLGQDHQRQIEMRDRVALVLVLRLGPEMRRRSSVLIGDREAGGLQIFLRLDGRREIEPGGEHALALAMTNGDGEGRRPAARAPRRKRLAEDRLLPALRDRLHAPSDVAARAGVEPCEDRGERSGGGHRTAVRRGELRARQTRHEGTEHDARERRPCADASVPLRPHRVRTLFERRAKRSRSGFTNEPPVSTSTESRPSLKKSWRRCSRRFVISDL